MKSKRFDENNWIRLGLERLSSQGAENLTIDKLCNYAGKTKGSFYFHFKNIDEYLEALVRFWFEEFTQKITSRPSPQTDRLDLLNQLAGRIDLNLETGIRSLALKNHKIRKIVTKADQSRLEWLTGLYLNSGQYDVDTAKALASIEIAAFAGFRLINPEMKPTEARELYQNFLKLTNRV